MNVTVKDNEFQASCRLVVVRHFLIKKFPSEKLVINQIFAIAFNSIVLIPILLLNGAAVITILKAQLLKSKPCYFITLLQSMFDLAVGLLGIPLAIYFPPY